MKTELKKNLSDKIVIFVAAYILIVIICFASVFYADTYSSRKISNLEKLLKNEKALTEIQIILMSETEEIRAELLKYVNSDSFEMMEKHETKVFTALDSIKNILDVIENGGVLNQNSISADSYEDTFQNELYYVNKRNSRFNIPVMDIRTKLMDIKFYVDAFRNDIIDMFIASSRGDSEKFFKSSDLKNQRLKKLDNFFSDMNDSLEKLYTESRISLKNLENNINQTEIQYRNYKAQISSLGAAVILTFGIVLLLIITKTISGRKKIREDLRTINRSLDSVIRERTAELEKELLLLRSKNEETSSELSFLKDIVESIPYPFYVVDIFSYEIVMANNAAFEIMGRDGNTCHEITHNSVKPCDGDLHPCPLKKVVETGKPFSVEHVHVTKNGMKRIFDVYGVPVFDNSGKIIYMIEMSIDITQRKEAEADLLDIKNDLEDRLAEKNGELEKAVRQKNVTEERLKSREKHFRDLMENISDVIMVVDKNLRLTYLSPSIEKHFGYSPDMLMDKSIEDIVHSRDRKAFQIWMEEIQEKDEAERNLEIRIQKRSGDSINSEITAKNLLGKEIINGIILSVRDVTLKKRGEEEIRKLAIVMEQTPSNVVVTDINGTIEYVNPAFEKTTGYTMKEAVGKNPRILKTDLTPHETFENMWKSISKGKIWKGELTNRKKNGEMYIEQAIIAPIMNDRGEIVNYLGMKDNITELKETKKKMQEFSNIKKDFLSNISHEIRTPLNGIIGFLDLLTATELKDDQKDFIKTIKYSAGNLMKILNDLLDMSKISSNIFTLDNVEFSIPRSLIPLIKMFYAKANENSLQMDTFIDPRLFPVVQGDPQRLIQAVTNLLGNAVKFTPEGGEISIEIHYLGENQGSLQTRFIISDNGIGISEDKLHSIFESFTQGDTAVTKKYGGTGLGLTISQNIIKQMNSEIKIESAKDKGTTVSFDIDFIKAKIGHEKICMTDEKTLCFAEGAESGIAALVQRYADIFGIKVHECSGSLAEGDACLFTQSSFDTEMCGKILDKGAKAVYIAESDEIIPESMDNRVSVLRIPFYGGALCEILNGEMYVENTLELPEIFKKFRDTDTGKTLKNTESADVAGSDYDVDSFVKKIGLPSEIITKLLNGFASELKNELKTFTELADKDEYAKLKSINHSYMGAAENLRLGKITELLAEMEKNIRLKSVTNISKCAESLDNEIEILLKSIHTGK